MVGGAKFYDRREIKDILAYVRVLANPDDEVSARRIVNVPKRGIGDTSVARLAAWAAGRARRASARPSTGPRRPGSRARRSREPSSSPGRWPSCAPLVQTVNPADFVQLVAERTGYLAELVAEHTHEADGRIENLAELASQAADFDDVMGFLETVALVADSDELDSDGTRVSLMTLHTAKGLEYPAVFVVGPGGGDLPPLPLPGRAERAGGGAPALLRRHHPGPAAPRHLARLVAHDLGPHPAGHAEPLRHRGARSHLVEDVGLGSPRRGSGYDSLSGEEHLPGGDLRAGRAAGARPRAPAGRSGARRPGRVPGQHRRRGPGAGAGRRGRARPLGPRRRASAPRGRGRRAQATVRFDSVGKKNLLLSATPLRRA